MFHRTFISAVVGTSIALSSIAATTAQAEGRYVYQQTRPSQGNEAVAAALAGLAALYIIGKTIDRNNDRHEKAAPVHRPHVSSHDRAARIKAERRAERKAARLKEERRAERRAARLQEERRAERRAIRQQEQRRAQRQAQRQGSGGHAHWHRHGNVKHIHRHGAGHHRHGH